MSDTCPIRHALGGTRGRSVSAAGAGTLAADGNDEPGLPQPATIAATMATDFKRFSAKRKNSLEFAYWLAGVADWG